MNGARKNSAWEEDESARGGKLLQSRGIGRWAEAGLEIEGDDRDAAETVPKESSFVRSFTT